MRAHEAHCPRTQLDHGLRHFGVAIFIEQTIQTFGAQFQGGQLTIQITPEAVGQTRVGAQNGQDIFFQNPCTQNSNRRDLHRFLPTLGGGRVVVTWHCAAHIVPVCCRCQEAKQFATPEKRPHQFEIIGVCAAFIGVVEQPNVTVLHAAARGSGFGSSAHGKGHGTHKHGQARFALHQSVARDTVVNAVTSIVRFGNDGVERAAVKRSIHLVGNLL